MLYPVAPEKIATFRTKLLSASKAESLPPPSIQPLDVSPEKALEIASRHVEGAELTDPVEGFHVIVYRGRKFALVDAEWPSPLRTLDGEMVLFTGVVPVGPDPRAMWQVLYLLPEAEPN